MFRYLRKKFHTTNTGSRLSSNGGAAKDVYWNLVSLLLRKKSVATANQTFVDSSTANNTVTVTGDVAQGSFGPFAGSSSAFFDGSGDYLTIPPTADLNFGTGDFTIEFWLYATYFYNGSIVFQLGDTYGGGNYCTMQQVSTNAGKFQVSSLWLTDSGAAKLNEWTHFAITRSGTSAKMFRNGVEVAASTNSTPIGVSGNPTYIGQVAGYYIHGYISNFHIIKGTAKYTSNFSIPTAPAIAHANTKLLLNFDNAGEVDASSKTALKLVGGAVVSTAQVKFSSSISLPGNGAQVTNPFVHNGLNFGTGDFTIEGWFYFDSAASRQYGIGCWQLSSAVGGLGGPYYTGLYNNNGAALELAYNGTGITTGFIPAMNTWYHIAMSRCNGVSKLFIDGVQKTSVADPMNYAAVYLCLGGYSQSGYCVGGYVEDFRITKGIARYIGEFKVYSDNAFSYAATQLHFEGTNGSTSVVDNKGITWSGSATLSTTQKKFGNTSLYFNGSTHHQSVVSSSLALGTQDFTLEFWVHPTNLWNSGPYAGNGIQFNGPFEIQVMSSSLLYYGGATISGGNVLANAWSHIAAVRTSGTVRLYINGVQVATGTDNTNYTSTQYTLGVRPGSGYNHVGYIDDFRMLIGKAAYSSNFTPPTTPYLDSVIYDPKFSTAFDTQTGGIAGDPYYNQTVLHMHMEGTNTSTKIVDQKGNVVTVSGNAKLSTAKTKFGTTSVQFDGNNGGLTRTGTGTDFAFGTGDFTIEFWFNPTNLTVGPILYDQRNGASDSSSTICIYVSGNVARLYVNAGDRIVGTTTIALNSWHHLAVSRSSGFTKLFLNGIQEGSTWTDSTNYISVNNRPTIGMRCIGDSILTGHMDEVRVTKGIARYTSNFTVPASAFPDYQDFTTDQYLNNTILLKGNASKTFNTFYDASSSNNQLISVGGVTKSTDTVPYAGATCFAFNGTSDAIRVKPDSLLAFGGSATFTLSAWIYLRSTNGASNYTARSIMSSGNLNLNFCVREDKKLQLYHYPGAELYPTSTGTISLNTWTHVAVSVTGGTITFYINGSASGTGSWGGSNDTTTSYIGYANGMSISYWDGYLADVKYDNAVMYSSDFIPPFAPAVATSSTKLLVNSVTQGSMNNNAILDSSPNNALVTRFGNVAQGTFSPFEANYDTNKYSWDFSNTGGAHFNIGSNPAFALGTGDFTMETWMYWNTDESSTAIFCGIGEPNAEQLTLWRNPDGRFSVRINQGDYLHTIIPNCAGNWHHIAVTRQGGTVRLFINGGMTGSMTNTYNMGQATCLIGSIHWAPTLRIIGKLSNFRIVKGTAVYTSGFTPPRKPLTAIAGTLVLCCQDSTFKDNSVNNWTLNPSGTTTVSTTSPLGVPYNAVTHGGSAYFDGAGDYLTLPYSPNMSLGGGDFTIELWANFQNSGSRHWLLNQWGTSPGNWYLERIEDGRVRFSTASGGSQVETISTVVSTAGTWAHIAVCRVGATVTVYVNGIGTSSTSVGVMNSDTITTYIGVHHNGGSYAMHGYLANINVIKGTAKYTSNFSVPTAPSTPHANTKLLLNFTNAAISDVTGKTVVETVGDSKVAVLQGNRCESKLYFDGTGDYIRARAPQFAFDTGDFTVECWFNCNTIASADLFGTGFPSWNGNTCIWLNLNGIGAGRMQVATNGAQYLGPTNTFVNNTWNHVAIVRSGTTLSLFLNGELCGAAATGISHNFSNDVMDVGAALSTNRFFQGSIEDFRVTKGVARYISNFTVPLKEFPVV